MLLYLVFIINNQIFNKKNCSTTIYYITLIRMLRFELSSLSAHTPNALHMLHPISYIAYYLHQIFFNI